MIENYNEGIQSGVNPQSTMLLQYLDHIIRGIQHVNPCVQESACSSFNQIVSKGSVVLLPFLEPVLKVFHNLKRKLKGLGFFIDFG